MLIIGEKINGMYKAVGESIKSHDKITIQDLARQQVQAGADMLDVNVGPAAEEPKEAMEWLVNTIHEAVDVPLSIDSPKPEVIEVGLKAHKPGLQPLINSTTGQQERLDKILPLTKQYNALLVGLTMDEKGIPNDLTGRCEIALRIISSAMEQGIAIEDIYLDPLILPVNVAQPQVPIVLETLSQLKTLSDPPPKTLLGLSNVSQKTQERELVNRTCLVMAIAHGLDAAICDPLDSELMNAMITAELLLNKTIYCDSFLQAYKKR